MPRVSPCFLPGESRSKENLYLVHVFYLRGARTRKRFSRAGGRVDKIGVLEMGRITNLGDDGDDVTREPHFLAVRYEDALIERTRVARDERIPCGRRLAPRVYPCARIENAIALIIHIPIQQNLNIFPSAPSLTNFLNTINRKHPTYTSWLTDGAIRARFGDRKWLSLSRGRVTYRTYATYVSSGVASRMPGQRYSFAFVSS